MKVFLSCSGKLSIEIGKVLREMLPMILQSLQPFLAVEDIKLGEFWSGTMEDILVDSQCAIICLTKENMSSPWLFYEAGILCSKKKIIIPLLIDITFDELRTNPLCAYQATILEKESMFSLIKTLNQQLKEPLDEKFVNKIFNVMWPMVYTNFQNVIANSEVN